MRNETTAVLTYMQESTVKGISCAIYEELVSSICDWGISPGSVQFINSMGQSAGEVRTKANIHESSIVVSFGWSGSSIRWFNAMFPEPSPSNSSPSASLRTCRPQRESCQTIPVPTMAVLSVPTAGKIKHPYIVP